MSARPEKTTASPCGGGTAGRIRRAPTKVGNRICMMPDLQDEATREEVMRQIRAAAEAEDDFREELEAWLELAGEVLEDE